MKYKSQEEEFKELLKKFHLESLLLQYQQSNIIHHYDIYHQLKTKVINYDDTIDIIDSDLKNIYHSNIIKKSTFNYPVDKFKFLKENLTFDEIKLENIPDIFIDEELNNFIKQIINDYKRNELAEIQSYLVLYFQEDYHHDFKNKKLEKCKKQMNLDCFYNILENINKKSFVIFRKKYSKDLSFITCKEPFEIKDNQIIYHLANHGVPDILYVNHKNELKLVCTTRDKSGTIEREQHIRHLYKTYKVQEYIQKKQMKLQDFFIYIQNIQKTILPFLNDYDMIKQEYVYFNTLNLTKKKLFLETNTENDVKIYKRELQKQINELQDKINQFLNENNDNQDILEIYKIFELNINETYNKIKEDFNIKNKITTNHIKKMIKKIDFEFHIFNDIVEKKDSILLKNVKIFLYIDYIKKNFYLLEKNAQNYLFDNINIKTFFFNENEMIDVTQEQISHFLKIILEAIETDYIKMDFNDIIYQPENFIRFQKKCKNNIFKDEISNIIDKYLNSKFSSFYNLKYIIDYQIKKQNLHLSNKQINFFDILLKKEENENNLLFLKN